MSAVLDIEVMTRAAMSEACKQKLIPQQFPRPQWRWDQIRAIVEAAVAACDSQGATDTCDTP